MDRSFFIENREGLYRELQEGDLVVVSSGHAPRKTSDEDYPFFTNRNFLYLTGIEQADTYLVTEIGADGPGERLYLLPPDFMKERWTGRRIKEDQAREISGIESFGNMEHLDRDLDRALQSGRIRRVYLDFDEAFRATGCNDAYRLGARIRRDYPYVQLCTLLPILRELRTIKKPCEIEAMRRAAVVTRAGIEAMMRASRPGMYEYQYKAEFDYALAQHGVLSPGFPSIISTGANNFCIHYNSYRGQAQNGDLVLNDVGAIWDYEINDVSRAWPCNGKFSERQRLLYQCAYATSEHMFRTLGPGVPMEEVDQRIRRYNFEQLKAAGVCDSYEKIGTYMWHGGAHHVGLDVHDVVNVAGKATEPGMVFCIDVGIYHEEWGIGFRLEDNCLITEDGCENLTRNIPRSIEAIEAVMAE